MRRPLSVALVVLALAGCTQSPPAPPAPSSTATVGVAASPVAGGCGDTPVWSGSPPAWTTGAGVPNGSRFVMSHEGNLVGVLFAFPLLARSPPEGPNNKILWIAREPRDGRPLRLTLRHDQSTVESEEPANSGPGEIYPSIVDVTGPGCWAVTAQWAGHKATLELSYS
jgi:hypothetical protein